MDGAGPTTIRTTCPYCGVGCGVLATPDGAGGISVKGDPDHPANLGRLCSKGMQLGQTVGLEERLLSPRIAGREATWDEALGLVAARFSETIAEHGPDSVAFYVSGQMLTEDYYVANKLMKGFIGSANIDTNSRLCMASTVAGHKRAFGSDTVPGTYEDLEAADLVVLVGSNLAWAHPVLYQRILGAKKSRGTRIVVIDPRRTASCDGAEMHLALSSGSDVALFNGLLAEIDRRGLADGTFLGHVEGAEAAFAAAHDGDLSVTGLDPAQIAAFFDLWCGTERVVTVFSQGVNQSSAGTDKVNAILNCHLATGRIGREGMGPFSVTGQPNAMGGREVGGLSNTLACHLDLEDTAHRDAVASFWGVSTVPDRPGLKAVDMFRAVEDGRIKALWIIHTNPAVTLPEADRVRASIAACPFTVVSDITAATDTARAAQVLLPAAAWAEKSGTVTNSDRTISRQRALLPIPGEARPDWDILADVARRMGHAEAFSFRSPAEIFREYAALSAEAGRLGRDFDISGLAGLTDDAYDTLPPTRWPVTTMRQGGRFFAEGAFFTPSGKARMLALSHRPPVAEVTPARPFRFNTGRLRDQWHTMTRTGLSPRLSAHLPEPFLEIHPEDAARLGLAKDALIEVTSDAGRAILRARVTDAVRPGDVFAPMHWTGETAPSARVCAAIAAATDPVSGQPESKAAAVSVTPWLPAWHGFLISRSRPDLGALAPDYSAVARTTAGWRVELAGQTAPDDWDAAARGLLGPGTPLSLSDAARGTRRFAVSLDGVLQGALFVARTPLAIARDHLATLPGTAAPHVLTGHPPRGTADEGALVCACMAVRTNTIVDAIRDKDLTSVDAIGEATEAGTSCGSCRPELRRLLERHQRRAAAV